MHPEISRAIAEIRTSKRELVAQILTVFIFPIILIQLGFIPINARIFVLIFLVSLLVVILFTEKWTLAMLGVAKASIKKYFLPYLIFTAITVLLITMFGESVTGKEELGRWWTERHFLYLFFIVSLFQEIAYRGYLIPALGKLIAKPEIVFFCNVVLFTFLHAIFPDPLISLPVAFVGGIGFAAMYMKYPSLPLIILCHALLNFFVVLYGFFVIPGVTY